MFEKDSRSDAPIPEMPTTEGIEVNKRACSRILTISADTRISADTDMKIMFVKYPDMDLKFVTVTCL